MNILRGTPGHPSHPPATDAAIGAFTVGALSLLLSIWWADPFGVVALVSVAIGLAAGLVAVATGLLDYVKITPGTPLHRTATAHLIAVVVALTLFGVSAILLGTEYQRGEVLEPGGVSIAVGLFGYAVLALGGWIGGTIVFVHGMRVESDPERPAKDAIEP